MKIAEIINLCEIYGYDRKLGDVLNMVRGNKIFKCPKCKGEGMVSVKYNAYPSGLPDSGWAYDWKYKDISCDLCNGEGYTSHEYKPKMIQDGWE